MRPLPRPPAPLALLAALLLLAAAPSPARSLPSGVALIVGSDGGVLPDGTRLPRLTAARATAGRLAVALRALRWFGDDDVVFVGDPTRAAFEVARARLHAVWERVRAGGGETVFVFGFVGHGVDGDLVLADGLLYRADVAALVEAVGADRTLVVFDACRNPSAQGIGPTGAPADLDAAPFVPPPGLQARADTAVLNSTTAGRLSYELSGRVLFSAALVEALSPPWRNGPVVTLGRVWRYVRERTDAEARVYGREQVPEATPDLTEDTAWAALELPFEVERSAALEIDPAVEGTLEVGYTETYVERRALERGAGPVLALYPGELALVLTEPDGRRRARTVTLPAGARARLAAAPEALRGSRDGERRREADLRAMGAPPDLAVAVYEPGPTLRTGLSYDLAFHRGVVQPKHAPLVEVRLDHGALQAALALGYGRDARDFATWGYAADAVVGVARLGAGWNLGSARLSLGAQATGGGLWLAYGAGVRRTTGFVAPGAYLGLLWPNDTPLAALLTVHGGAAWGPGAAISAPHEWAGYAAAGLGLLVRAF